MENVRVMPANDDEARRAKRLQYRENYKAAHLEAFKASKRRGSARLRQRTPDREAQDPTLRAKRLDARKANNDAHKAARAAYNKAYRARKRAERDAAKAGGLGGAGLRRERGGRGGPGVALCIQRAPSQQ